MRAIAIEGFGGFETPEQEEHPDEIGPSRAGIFPKLVSCDDRTVKYARAFLEFWQRDASGHFCREEELLLLILA
jgi:hypothetical protein